MTYWQEVQLISRGEMPGGNVQGGIVRGELSRGNCPEGIVWGKMPGGEISRGK